MAPKDLKEPLVTLANAALWATKETLVIPALLELQDPMENGVLAVVAEFPDKTAKADLREQMEMTEERARKAHQVLVDPLDNLVPLALRELQVKSARLEPLEELDPPAPKVNKVWLAQEVCLADLEKQEVLDQSVAQALWVAQAVRVKQDNLANREWLVTQAVKAPRVTWELLEAMDEMARTAQSVKGESGVTRVLLAKVARVVALADLALEA